MLYVIVGLFVFFMVLGLLANIITALKNNPAILFIIACIAGLFFAPTIVGGVVALLVVWGIADYIITRIKIKSWLSKDMPNLNSYAITQALDGAIGEMATYDANPQEYKYTKSEAPMGRSSAFLNYFGRSIQSDEVLYYSPLTSNEKDELREYGTIITDGGVFLASQESEKNDEGKYPVHEKAIPFDGVWSAKIVNEQLYIETVDVKKMRKERIIITKDETTLSLNNLSMVFQTVISNDIALYYSKLSHAEKLKKRKLDTYKDKRTEPIIQTAGVMGAQQGIHEVYSENKYYMNGARGGGYAAEYANNTDDRLAGRKVENMAQQLDESGRQVKHGADRMVDGIAIQTKYYKTASESIGAAFQHKQALYINEDGTMMSIEVPADQYQDALRIMQKRIDSGQVPNANPGDDPSAFVRKGSVTYEQAQNVAKAGTVESLSMDFKAGIVTCSAVGGISAAISFAMSVWHGKDPAEAAKGAFVTGIKVMGKGAFIYTVSMQLSRDRIAMPLLGKEYTGDGISKGFVTIDNPIFGMAETMADSISGTAFANSDVGQFLGLDNMNGRGLISTGVTGAVVFGPDICRALTGRISSQQLIKNSTVGASGIAGSVIGQALIPIPVVGAMVGGIAAGMLGKKVADAFIEDDATLMFQILKEEFLDVVTIAGVTTIEFDQIVTLTLAHKKLPNRMRDMYQSKEYRNFAREEIIKPAVLSVYEERETITDEMFSEGYTALLEPVQQEVVAV